MNFLKSRRFLLPAGAVAILLLVSLDFAPLLEQLPLPDHTSIPLIQSDEPDVLVSNLRFDIEKLTMDRPSVCTPEEILRVSQAPFEKWERDHPDRVVASADMVDDPCHSEDGKMVITIKHFPRSGFKNLESLQGKG